MYISPHEADWGYQKDLGPTQAQTVDLSIMSQTCLLLGYKNTELAGKELKVVHSALMVNLIKLFGTRKKLLQHEYLTPIESGITLSQIL